jgi:phosphoglycerol transferase MdoB-like AlkP superfamily enzyme
MNHPEYTNDSWNLKQQFVQQIQFTNKKSIEFIDKILENEKQSIIIIQSDHGSAFGINLQDPTDDDVFQKLSNLNAIYFPDEKHREMLTDDRTNVNTFRIVFNSYFGSNYEMLEDRTYWDLSIKKPFWFKDVTSVVLN